MAVRKVERQEIYTSLDDVIAYLLELRGESGESIAAIMSGLQGENGILEVFTVPFHSDYRYIPIEKIEDAISITRLKEVGDQDVVVIGGESY